MGFVHINMLSEEDIIKIQISVLRYFTHCLTIQSCTLDIPQIVQSRFAVVKNMFLVFWVRLQSQLYFLSIYNIKTHNKCTDISP